MPLSAARLRTVVEPPQFEAASGALIIAIGTYLLWAAFNHRHDERTNGRALALVTGNPVPTDDLRLDLRTGERRIDFGASCCGGDGCGDGYYHWFSRGRSCSRSRPTVGTSQA